MFKLPLPPAVLVLFAVQYVAFALPVSNITANASSPPSPSPSCNDILHCRTLTGLVWSCLTTIFLCTWVALHPNVPAAKESWGFLDRIFSTRLGLLVLVLASPELVVLLASSDWSSASRLITALSQKYPEIRWTETHGMMMVMGGFEVLKDDDPESEPQKTRLTARNLEENALEGYEGDMSTITEDVIKDKSKGDAIAKVVVVLQTVTKLELTTLGHTAFISIIYFFWWNKPVSVRYPITLHAKLQNNINTAGSAAVIGSDDATDAQSSVSSSLSTATGSAAVIDSNDSIDARSDIPSNLPTAGSAEPAVTGSDDDTDARSGVPPGSLQIKEDPVVTPSHHHLPWRIRFGAYLTSSKILDFRSHRLLPSVLRITFEVVITGTFGAIHCLGWNFQFISHVERVFWRTSTLVVTALPGIILVLSYGRWESGDLDSAPVFRTHTIVLIILMCLYICARISLLVLAFLALRDLPFGSYQIPSWITFIPHL